MTQTYDEIDQENLEPGAAHIAPKMGTMAYISLALWIIGFEAVSWGIGLLTQGEVDGWYQALDKPPLNPPDIAFPIAWGLLYVLLAATGWYLWHHRKSGQTGFIWALFLTYMGFNWSWMFIFFSAHMVFAAFLWISVLNVLSVMIITLSRKVAKPVYWMMIPPTIWTLFAAYLNGGILILN